MKLNPKQKKAINAIFNNPQAFGKTTNHAQTVVDVIFQTQVYLLGIDNEKRKLEVINLRIDSLVKELRYGKKEWQYNIYYKAEPLDPMLIESNKENDEFWAYVRTLLIDSVQWNYQADIIKDSLKKKVFLYFLANPTKSISVHSATTREALLNRLLPQEQALFREKFLEIDIWAKAVEQNYQTASYPIIPMTVGIIFTAISYGLDQLSPLTTLALFASEIGGAYLWSTCHFKPLYLKENHRKDLIDATNKEFLNENKLNLVRTDSDKKEEEESKIIYTKFNERLPNRTQNVDNVEKDIIRPKPEQKFGKKPKAQQATERKFDVNSNIETQPSCHQWGTINSNTKHVVETWGRYSQINCFAFFNKDSKTIQKLKQENKSIYKELKKIVLWGHVVGPEGQQGIKKLNYPFKNYTYEAKLLGSGENEYRFYAKEVASLNSSATLYDFDYCGPALHK